MWKKIVFEIFSSSWKYADLSFVKVSYECVMVACLKEIYRANTISPFIFYVGGTQALIVDANYHERNP